MATFRVKQHDTTLPLSAETDITGATVTAFIRTMGVKTEIASTVPVDVTDPVAGDFDVIVTDVAYGDFDLEVLVVKDGEEIRIPSAGYHRLLISPNLDDPLAGPYVPSATLDQVIEEKFAGEADRIIPFAESAVEAAAEAGSFAASTEFDANRAGESAFQSGQSAGYALGHRNAAAASAEAAGIASTAAQTAASSIGVVNSIEGESPSATLTRLNLALSAGSATRRTVILRGDFAIPEDTTLVVASNTTVDARQARIYCPDNTYPIIRNERAQFTTSTPTNPTNGTGVRDSDIRIIGGLWESGGGAGAGHRLFFHQVDGISITDVEVRSAGGKYAILLADVTRADVYRPKFAVASDGLHVTGPASDIRVTGASGYTGDDFVAFGCSDYVAYDYSRGNISNVSISTLRPALTSNAGNGVKLFTTDDASISTSPGNITDVTISDVRGSVRSNGIVLLNGPGGGGLFDRVTIAGVSVTTRDGYSQVQHNWSGQGSVGTLTVRDVQIPPAMSGMNCNGVKMNGGPISTLIVDGLTMTQTAGTIRGVHLLNATAGNVTVSKAVGSGASANGAPAVSITGSTAVSDLTLTDVAWSGGHVVSIENTSSVTNATLRGRYIAGTGYAVNLASSTTLNVVFDWTQTVSTALVLSGATATAEVYGRIAAGGGSQFRGVSRTGSQVVNLRSLGLEVNLAAATKTAGALAFNRNLGLSCGVGPVTCDGTIWKNLATGATY